MVEIQTLELGPMDNYIHLVVDSASSQVAVVDPAWEPEKILAYTEQKGLQIAVILLTHGHHDHINGVEMLQQASGVPVYINRLDEVHFGLEQHGWSSFDVPFQYRLGESTIQAVATPGHTPGSTCYHAGNNLITGDTLFVYGCGRCDLEGGDPTAMFQSLNHLLETFDPSTRIYPGHSYSVQPSSTLEEERLGNPFLHCRSEAEFVEYRMVRHDRERGAPYGPVSS